MRWLASQSLITLTYIKKFTYVNQESYKLDHIAFVELGERKLESGLTTSKTFTLTTFRDSLNTTIKMFVLFEKLEKKLGLLELALALAYTAKVNLGDVFSQVRTWDQIIYHHLRAKDIVILARKMAARKRIKSLVRMVHEPITGRHDWVVLRPQQSVSAPYHAIQYLSRYKNETRDGFPKNPCVLMLMVFLMAQIYVKKNLTKLKEQNFLSQQMACVLEKIN